MAKTLNCLKKLALTSNLYPFITDLGVVHMDPNKTTRCDEFAVDNIDCSKWPERFVAKDSHAQCFCQNKLAVLVETLWFPTWIRDS